MTPPKRSAPASVYQLKITLVGLRPPIWRRVLATSDTKLSKLHDIIQRVMPWGNAHLHEFTVGGRRYSPEATRYSDPEFGLEETKSEYRVSLGEVATAEKARLTYLYDFGDGWDHGILVEKILPVEEGKRYPVCVGGKRACPPDDCGGTWGYVDFLEAIQDPQHPEHQTFVEWIGGSWDPEEFDLEAVNEVLTRIR